jgi:FMN phosphatase YigB (HAD superfamily)
VPIDPTAGTVEAVVFDVDDVLVPFHTVRAFQWAWKPNGPVLAERRTASALRRSLRSWDRRRWLGVTGRAEPADLAALLGHLASTLREVAGRAVPPEESEAVVRRLLHPAGEVERFDDVLPALERLRSAGRKVGALTALPAENARWLLRRVGVPDEILLAGGDPPGPVAPARETFRAAAERLGAPLERTAFVGDLFWSDVRAAQRAGLVGVLLDRSGGWPHVQGGRITSLAELGAALAAAATPAPAGPTDDGPVAPGDPPPADLL